MIRIGGRIEVRLKLLMLSALVLLGACDQRQCIKPKPLPYRQYSYFDRQVYVYETTELFELLQPQALPDFSKKLAVVTAYAKANPDMEISISSYANNASNSTAATEQRDFAAEAVAAQLWVDGVMNTMRYKGYPGGKHSVSSNVYAALGAENRRIEIEFYDKHRT